MCVTFIMLFKEIDLATLRLIVICSLSTSTVELEEKRGIRIDSLEETP